MTLKSTVEKFSIIVVLSMMFSCGQNEHPASEEARVLIKEDTLPLPPPPKVNQSILTVQDIQDAYTTIVSSYEKGRLDSSSFKYNCDGEKSGTVSYFTENGVLKMIKHDYAEYDHHEMVDVYYVENSKPFFAHLKSLSWSFDSGPEGATKDVVTENRIYLNDWKAIKCLEKKYEIRKHAGVNPKPATVPNKELDCTAAKSIEKPYRLLAKYWDKTAPECLK